MTGLAYGTRVYHALTDVEAVVEVSRPRYTDVRTDDGIHIGFLTDELEVIA